MTIQVILRFIRANIVVKTREVLFIVVSGAPLGTGAFLEMRAPIVMIRPTRVIRIESGNITNTMSPPPVARNTLLCGKKSFTSKRRKGIKNNSMPINMFIKAIRSEKRLTTFLGCSVVIVPPFSREAYCAPTDLRIAAVYLFVSN